MNVTETTNQTTSTQSTSLNQLPNANRVLSFDLTSGRWDDEIDVRSSALYITSTDVDANSQLRNKRSSNQATRQSSNQAIRQSSNQATKQSNNKAIKLGDPFDVVWSDSGTTQFNQIEELVGHSFFTFNKWSSYQAIKPSRNEAIKQSIKQSNTQLHNQIVLCIQGQPITQSTKHFVDQTLPGKQSANRSIHQHKSLNHSVNPPIILSIIFPLQTSVTSSWLCTCRWDDEIGDLSSVLYITSLDVGANSGYMINQAIKRSSDQADRASSYQEIKRTSNQTIYQPHPRAASKPI